MNPLTKYLYLGVALALAALLSFTHLAAYRKGKANVRAEWTLSIAQANTDARKLEQQRQRRADEAGVIAARRTSALADGARRARLAADSLRDDLDAAKRYAKESRAAAERTAKVATGLLKQCSKRYLDVAESAARADIEARQLRDAWPK